MIAGKLKKEKYLGKKWKNDGPLPLAFRYLPTGVTKIATTKQAT